MKKKPFQYHASMEMMGDDTCMRTTNIEMRMNQDKKRGSNSKKKTQTIDPTYKTFQGKVLDKETQQPLIFAAISVILLSPVGRDEMPNCSTVLV